MKIVCPQCEFGRDIPDERLPAKSVIATCPRCKHRFRVSDTGVVNEDEVVASTSTPTTGAGSVTLTSAAPTRSPHGGDDPLPPGAIIPREETAASPTASAAMMPPVLPASSAPVTADSTRESDAEARHRAAAEAYARQAEANAEQEDVDNFAIDNPWENPRDGYPAAFYQTSMRVMFAAPRFFAGLMPAATQWRPLVFYLVVGVLQIVIERLWGGVLSSALAPAAGSDPQLQNLLQMLDPETSLAMTVLLRSAMITLELFFAAALYHLVFRLVTPNNANFSLVFQVLAYSSAPALLCIVPVAGSIAGFIWGLACSFIGCRYALRLSLNQTVLALVPLYLLGIPLIFFLLQGIQVVTG